MSCPPSRSCSLSPTWCASSCTTRLGPGGRARFWRPTRSWRGPRQTRTHCARPVRCPTTASTCCASSASAGMARGALRLVPSPAGRRTPRPSPSSTPCCGSGHFLTEALAILAALRQADEHLSPADAVAAVLRDNLHGLEIDGRCVQIAAFAVALSAWRIGGWHTLPLPHIAWVGSPPPLAKAQFTGLADGDAELVSALGALYDVFSKSPVTREVYSTQ